MASADSIRNSIIDKLLAISNRDFLNAIDKIVGNIKVDNEVVQLTEEQKLMLQMSESDIQNGKLISQDDLDNNDLEWLKGK